VQQCGERIFELMLRSPRASVEERGARLRRDEFAPWTSARRCEHAAVYRARPEVQAVVHTHSPRATALSCARRGIPPFHYMVLLAGGEVRCADHATFGTEALAGNAIAALEGRRAVLLANHGVVACGATLTAAVALAFEIENLAGQYLDLLAAGLQPVLLNARDLAEAAAQFGGYGRA
jgi:L-fuculose-phosphate aldolase